MHGVIFYELKKYVDSTYGGATWKALLEESGIGFKSYLSTQQYPDEDLLSLLNTASKKTAKPVPSILRSFGEFLVPDLMSMYKAFTKPDWRALDLLENVEATMHRAVRLQNPGAAPPLLQCVRKSPVEVLITYSSPRKLCALAEGMIKGVADYYKEEIRVSQQTCMLRGGSTCQISSRLAAGG